MFSLKVPNDNEVAVYIRGKERQNLYLHNDGEGPDFFELFEPADGVFQLLPTQQPGQTQRIAICASSGAGKSTFINNYIDEFYRIFPDSKNVILFTRQSEEDFDRAFLPNREKIDVIQLDDSLLDEKLDIRDMCVGSRAEGYKPQLILFDDYEGCPFKLADEVARLRNEICSNGRKLNLYLICSQTNLDIGTRSFRDFLGNCTQFVTFPSRSSTNIRYALEKHFDVTARVWSSIKRHIGSRWVIFNRQGIPYILCETAALIYDSEREDNRIKKEGLRGIAGQPGRVLIRDRRLK
jgi:hypothetical protein